MSKVAVWAKIPAAPGKRDDLAAALANALETAKAEGISEMFFKPSQKFIS